MNYSTRHCGDELCLASTSCAESGRGGHSRIWGVPCRRSAFECGRNDGGRTASRVTTVIAQKEIKSIQAGLETVRKEAFGV